MDVSVGVLLALIPLFGWGFADLIARFAVEKEHYYKVLFYSQALGIPITLLTIFFLGGFNPLSPSLIPHVFVLGFLWTMGFLFYYKAILAGKLSIVSPVAASWALIPVFFGVFVFGNQITFLTGTGIVLSIFGVILASTSFSEVRKYKKAFLMDGVPYALAAMLSWGFMFAFLGDVVDGLGPFMPVLILKSLLILFLAFLAPLTGKSISFPVRSVFPLIFLNGLFEVIAFLGFNYSLQTEFISVVSPVAAAFPAVTVVLAHYFLKERIELNQKIGILLILLGLIFLAIIF